MQRFKSQKSGPQNTAHSCLECCWEAPWMEACFPWAFNCACCLNWAFFSFVISWLDWYSHDATMPIQFRRMGIEKTREMNIPLLSKYWWVAINLQLFDANWLIFSEKYTRNSKIKKRIIWKLLWFLVRRTMDVTTTWNTIRANMHGSLHSMLTKKFQIPLSSSKSRGWMVAMFTDRKSVV